MYMGNYVLVVVPHADDEVLMCGGSIAKHLESEDRVDVVILQKNRNSRTQNQLVCANAAKKVLNYTNLHLLNIDNSLFSSNFVHVKDSLENFLTDVDTPDIVYTVSPFDNHQDHQMLYKVISVVFRIHGDRPAKKILCGETISSTDRSFKYFSSFNPNCYNTLVQRHIDLKVEALKQYKDEMFSMPHPRSEESVRSLAKVRGIECNHYFAEAFCCVRDIT